MCDRKKHTRILLAVLAVAVVIGGCSLSGENATEDPPGSASFTSDDPSDCVRELHQTTDTTRIVGTWNLVELNSTAWISGCMRTAGEDLGDRSHGLTFESDGLYKTDGSDWQPYRFVPLSSGWVGLDISGSLAPLSIHQDTLILDYRANDGDQHVYVRVRRDGADQVVGRADAAETRVAETAAPTIYQKSPDSPF